MKLDIVYCKQKKDSSIVYFFIELHFIPNNLISIQYFLVSVQFHSFFFYPFKRNQLMKNVAM